MVVGIVLAGWRTPELVRRTALEVYASRCARVVVIGPRAVELGRLPVTMILAADWRRGVGRALDAEAVILCEADDRVTAELIDALALAPGELVATRDGDLAGLPARFPRSTYARLLGDESDLLRGATFVDRVGKIDQTSAYQSLPHPKSP